MAGLPISRIVNSQVSITALLAQEVPINTMMIATAETVINPVERLRRYASLAAIGADFGVNSAAYLAATPWFGQSPQPNEVTIGRWVKAASHGQLIGGMVAGANLLFSAWTPFTAGAFYIEIDGVPHALSGINLGTVTNLNAVAFAIQTALVNAGAVSATVAWDAIYDRFTINSGTAGSYSSVSFLQSPRATGSVLFAGQPANNDTVTIKGTAVTFVTGTPTAGQVKIGVDLATTLNNLVAYLSASVDANLVAMTYRLPNGATPAALHITSVADGVTGNSYTLAISGVNLSVSAATLTGGVSTANDLSIMLAMRSTTSDAYAVPGMAAESALSAANALHNAAPGQWYGFFFDGITDSDAEALAAWSEASNPQHYFVVNSQDPAVVSPVVNSDLASVLASLRFNKTAIQYSSTSLYAVVSYLARILTTAWNGRNTVITEMFKDEPGIIWENLSSAQADALERKHCNVLARYNSPNAVAGDLGFIQYGVSCSGIYTDTIIGADWWSGHVQTTVFNVLRGAPTKIPQTDAGMTMLMNAAESASIDAVNNGYLGRGLPWESPGFGTLNTGDVMDKGFYVFAPPMATQSQAVRETRRATVMQIAGKTAGAIHGADVMIYIQQ